MTNIVFHPQGWENFTYWPRPPRRCCAATALIEETRRTPSRAPVNPEPLRRNLSGFSSRRVDDEHRLVYGATEDELIIIQARYHYDGDPSVGSHQSAIRPVSPAAPRAGGMLPPSRNLGQRNR